MLAREFIYENLQLLSNNFPLVEIKYQYNREAQTHIVELTPPILYYEDYALENAWMAIVDKFMEKFPAEDLSFISSDSILHIDLPEYSFNTHFVPSHFLSSNITVFQEYWTQAAEYLISKVDFQQVALPHLGQPIAWEQVRIWDTFHSFGFHYQGYIGHEPPANLLSPWQYPTTAEKQVVDTTVPDNTQYAMAA